MIEPRRLRVLRLWAAQTFVIVLLCQSSTINIHCLDESSLQVHTAAVMQMLVCVTLPPKIFQLKMSNCKHSDGHFYPNKNGDRNLAF